MDIMIIIAFMSKSTPRWRGFAIRANQTYSILILILQI